MDRARHLAAFGLTLGLAVVVPAAASHASSSVGGQLNAVDATSSTTIRVTGLASDSYDKYSWVKITRQQLSSGTPVGSVVPAEFSVPGDETLGIGHFDRTLTGLAASTTYRVCVAVYDYQGSSVNRLLGCRDRTTHAAVSARVSGTVSSVAVAGRHSIRVTGTIRDPDRSGYIRLSTQRYGAAGALVGTPHKRDFMHRTDATVYLANFDHTLGGLDAGTRYAVCAAALDYPTSTNTAFLGCWDRTTGGVSTNIGGSITSVSSTSPTTIRFQGTAVDADNSMVAFFSFQPRDSNGSLVGSPTYRGVPASGTSLPGFASVDYTLTGLQPATTYWVCYAVLDDLQPDANSAFVGCWDRTTHSAAPTTPSITLFSVTGSPERLRVSARSKFPDGAPAKLRVSVDGPGPDWDPEHTFNSDEGRVDRALRSEPGSYVVCAIAQDDDGEWEVPTFQCQYAVVETEARAPQVYLTELWVDESMRLHVAGTARDDAAPGGASVQIQVGLPEDPSATVTANGGPNGDRFEAVFPDLIANGSYQVCASAGSQSLEVEDCSSVVIWIPGMELDLPVIDDLTNLSGLCTAITAVSIGATAVGLGSAVTVLSEGAAASYTAANAGANVSSGSTAVGAVTLFADLAFCRDWDAPDFEQYRCDFQQGSFNGAGCPDWVGQNDVRYDRVVEWGDSILHNYPGPRAHADCVWLIGEAWDGVFTLEIRDQLEGMRCVPPSPNWSLAENQRSIQTSPARQFDRLATTSSRAAPGNEAWVIHHDDTRQWVNGSCRDQLVAAGAPLYIESWATISQSPNTQDAASCSDLVMGASDAAGAIPNTSMQLVTTSSRQAPGNEAWIIHDDGSRQWIAGDCRDQLEFTGMPLSIEDWSWISDHPQAAAATRCDDLVQQPSGSP